jgi:glucosamine--fructose-6-phosphate aminotransferase (isomerizing)
MDVKPGTYTYGEILSQSDIWAATLAAAEAQADELRSWLARPRPEVIFTGCGSTYYLSLSAAAIWQILTGNLARALPASELWLFPESSLPRPPSLLVAVSRSAETTETLRAVDMYRQRGGSDVLAVTCYADQPLTAVATRTLVAHEAKEESVAQTRSFTSMLLLTQFVAALASRHTDLLDQLWSLPALAGRVIASFENLARRLGQTPSLARFVFLGSGPNYGLACEAMLKMKEMSLSASEAFHFLEFRHGPKSTVGPDMLVVGLVSETARAQETAVLAEMRRLGAHVLAVAESVDALPADEVVALNSHLSDAARAPLVLPILQLMAYYRARSKGLNPDRPTHLEAVVKLDREI